MYEENSEGFQNGISISDVPGYFGCSEISFVEFQECQPHWYIYLNFFMAEIYLDNSIIKGKLCFQLIGLDCSLRIAVNLVYFLGHNSYICKPHAPILTEKKRKTSTQSRHILLKFAGYKVSNLSGWMIYTSYL